LGEIIGGSFVIVFPRIFEKVTPLQTKLSDTQKRILDYLSKEGEASTSELVEKLQIAPKTVHRHVNKLKYLLKWTGKTTHDPKGKYAIKDNVDDSKVTE
jgi:Mn-dependent DtxR family transcriptional regulator